MGLFGKLKLKKEAYRPEIQGVPEHVAIIMDGNGRWAQKRGLTRSAGHLAGSENFRRIAIACGELGVSYLTVYAFSTENWKRPKEEIDSIMELLVRYMRESCSDLQKNNARLNFIGDLTVFPEEIRRLKDRLDEISKTTTGIVINICLNYGGRAELVRAARMLAEMTAENRLEPGNINEETFSRCLYTAGVPDPDLLIKPGGELRLSNFLLWQLAYTEFYFSEVLWPDFDRAELLKAFAHYARRRRRFGGL